MLDLQGMVGVIAHLCAMTPKKREKALFANEISHARVKLAAREKRIARAEIAARASKLDSRETRVQKMQNKVDLARESRESRDKIRAEKTRADREKRDRLAAQKFAMNAAARAITGSSVSGTRTAFDNLSGALHGRR